MVIRTIKLTSLFVNTENYRFEPLSSQKEAIDKMIEDQGDKLYSLVDDIYASNSGKGKEIMVFCDGIVIPKHKLFNHSTK